MHLVQTTLLLNHLLETILNVYLMFVGDMLGIKTVRAWEFNSTFPIRSIIPIYVSTALPLLFLRAISALCGHVISWYSVTVAVRLMVTLLSLITDYTAMQLSALHATDAMSAAVVVATSYVSLVYYTRTFSNTLESFLYAALLCVVTRKSCSPRILPFPRFPYATAISLLIVLGVFNRPTFVIYAAVPYLWWLFSDGVCKVSIKVVKSVLMAVPVSVLLIVCDSIYFGHLDINNLNVADMSDIVTILTRNLTVAPINFILYNVQSDNLAEHGIHPRYTHFAINLPLLFNVLCVGFFYDVFTTHFRIHNRKLLSMYRDFVMLLICCVVPVGLLSLFPHQEPRFLIPLLPVLAALYARELHMNHVMMAMWIVANLFSCLFYGSIHQAGVLPCLGYLQQTRSTAVDRHVIFWHTYTAPQHFLLMTRDPPHGGNTTLTSLEGKSFEDLIHHLTAVNSSWSAHHGGKPEVMLAVPSSEHYYLVCRAADAGITLDLYQSFWPHLSTEHLPGMEDIMCRTRATNCHTNIDAADDDDYFCTKTLMQRIRFLTSLNLYQVTFYKH